MNQTVPGGAHGNRAWQNRARATLLLGMQRRDGAGDDHSAVPHSIRAQDLRLSEVRALGRLPRPAVEGGVTAAAEETMNPADEFLKRAVDCQRMTKFARDPQSRATWLRMAERWRLCAEKFAANQTPPLRREPRRRAMSAT